MVANIVNCVPQEDIYKLALFVAMPREAQAHFRSKLHLPVQVLKKKIVKYWEEFELQNCHLLSAETDKFKARKRWPTKEIGEIM